MKNWITIEQFPNYEVSGSGLIRNKNTGNELKPWITKNGYLNVTLFNNGISKNMRIHRLVATAFIKNEKNKPEVNHIDGNKLNNNYLNLEWSNRSENIKHAYRCGLLVQSDKNKIASSIKNSKQVIDLLTGIVYNSLIEACKINFLSYQTARKQIQLKLKTQRFIYITK